MDSAICGPAEYSVGCVSLWNPVLKYIVVLAVIVLKLEFNICIIVKYMTSNGCEHVKLHTLSFMAIIDAFQFTELCGMWGMVPTDDDLAGCKYWSSK